MDMRANLRRAYSADDVSRHQVLAGEFVDAEFSPTAAGDDDFANTVPSDRMPLDPVPDAQLAAMLPNANRSAAAIVGDARRWMLMACAVGVAFVGWLASMVRP